MPTYNLGQGITHGTDDLVAGLQRLGVQMQKDKQDRETVQAMLDQAKQMQFNDMRTGKPKNFFSDDQLHHIQRLIDQKHYHAAGAAEAAMGIGKDMYTRIQSAAAKQQAAAMKQAAADALELKRQQIMQQGPVTMRDKNGIPYKFNSHTNNWEYAGNDQATNAQNQKIDQQIGIQQKMMDFESEQQKGLRTVVGASMKALKLTPQQLFDSAKQQAGTVIPGRGFLDGEEMLKEYKANNNDPNGLPSEFTHVRIGYQAPSKELAKAGAYKGQPVNPGRPGSVLSLPEFNALRDAAATASGPLTSAAWKWINTSPESTATDFLGQPWTEDSIKQYQKQLPSVRKRFEQDIAQGFELPTQSQVKGEAAPAATPGAAFPVAPQPVVAPPQEDQQVSDEAADQNPGY